MRRFLGGLLLIAAAITVLSCGDNSTSPTLPEPVLTNEAFDGALTTGGSVYHLFYAKAGQIRVTLTAVEDPTIKLGMELGVSSLIGCTAGLNNPDAIIGSRLEGLASSLTTMCIYMYDPGTIPLARSVAYHLTVSHY